MITEESDSNRNIREQLERLPEIKHIRSFSDDINTQFEQATQWTPIMVFGAVIFAIGMALFLHLTHISPHSQLTSSNEGILAAALILTGGLLASWKYTIFTWYRRFKEYQFLGDMARTGKYAWIPFVVVAGIIVILVMIVLHGMHQS